MGYQLLGAECVVDSWEGTVNAHLVDNWIAGRSLTFNQSSPGVDVTQYGASLVAMKKKASLRTATLSFDGIGDVSTLAMGNAGTATFSGGYVTWIKGWTFNVAATVHDITSFTGSAVTAKAFRPGLLTFSGTFTCMVDSSTALVQTAIPSTAAASLVLTLSSTNTITVQAIATQLSVSAPIDGMQEVTYSWESDDNGVTCAGSDNIIPAGDFALPEWNAAGDGVPDRDIVFTLKNGGLTYTAPAFWSSLSINCPVDGLITTSATIQIAGAVVQS